MPEGAAYDTQSRRLTWTPGPGQIGDHTVTATVSDGRGQRSETFVLRVVANASANAPTIAITTTPATPAVPGQNIVATVRAEAGSFDYRDLRVAGARSWDNVALDAAVTSLRTEVTQRIDALSQK